MTIQHKQTGSKGTFFIEEKGETLAEMVYTMPAADKMIIEHTEVDESLQGKKIGSQLVQHAVEYARDKNISIVPLCSFARATFEKSPQYKDVLA